MLEQDFEKLLASYFEEEISEEELVSFSEVIKQTPAYRRRFQRELRLHSLMREAAQVIQQDDEGTREPAARNIIHRFGWMKVAAVLLLCGFLGQMILSSGGSAETVGHCLHVSDGEDLSLLREGKTLSVESQTKLEAGDRISTGSRGQASFDLKGVGMLTLKSETEVEVFPVGEAVAVAVKRGLVLVEAEKREPGTPPVLFRTPKAEVEVMGTVFGLEVNAAATRVRVHEGLVKFSDRSSERSVEVEAGQYSVNGGEQPEVRDQTDLVPGALMPGQFRLLPTDDACSDRKKFLNGRFLKVENSHRKSYLKFQVPEGSEILGAKLRLTQSVDPGEGKLRVWEGSHHDWSEHSLSRESAPEPLRQVGERKGWVGLDQVIDLDVSSLVKNAGTYTILLTLEGKGSNDIWFASKESPNPPELIVTRIAE